MEPKRLKTIKTPHENNKRFKKISKQTKQSPNWYIETFVTFDIIKSIIDTIPIISSIRIPMIKNHGWFYQIK